MNEWYTFWRGLEARARPVCSEDAVLKPVLPATWAGHLPMAITQMTPALQLTSGCCWALGPGPVRLQLERAI